MRSATRAAWLFVAGLTITTSAFAEDAKRQGVIVSKSDQGVNVRTREGDLTIVLTPTTKIRETSGVLQKKDREATALIPGLIITAEGDLQGTTLTAAEVSFTERDWKTAVATKAGTQQEFAELRRAIIEGQEYVIQKETTVHFASGSTAISAADKAALTDLAGSAASFGNYRISILGFADQQGNAEANERLSLKRAGVVSNFMRQTGKIEPGRVLSPSAMGEGTTAPGETAPTSDAEARRVVVRVVTPKTQLTQ